MEEIVNIKRILRCFEVMSTLKINYQNSTVSGVGMGVDMDSLKTFASILKCEAKSLPIKYLGLPFSGKSVTQIYMETYLR